MKRIIGIATEPPPRPGDPSGSSEDMILAEQPDWTPELIENLEADCEDFGVMREGVFTETRSGVTEYPDEAPPRSRTITRPEPGPQLNRRERRAQAAKRRRNNR